MLRRIERGVAFCCLSVALVFIIATPEAAAMGSLAVGLAVLRTALLRRDLAELGRMVTRLVAHLPDAICVIDADDVVLSANPAAIQLFGSATIGCAFAPLRRALGRARTGGWRATAPC